MGLVGPLSEPATKIGSMYMLAVVTAAPEPVVTTGLADEIAFRVETAILDGLYPPGSRLPQEELCERFAVSRTPVREALRKLQAKSLVVVVPNKGATVRLLSRKELLDIYEAQAELEAAVSVLDAVTDGVDPAGTQLRMKHANDWFHAAIHQTAGNAPLMQVIKDLGDRCPKDYISRALRVSPEVRDLNIGEHRRIRAAVGAGDGRAARLAMRDHILHARTVIAAYLDEQGFWGER